MKRALPVVGIAVAILAVPIAALVFGGRAVWMRAGRLEWPMELGAAADLAERYPKHGISADAQRLAVLARPAGIDFLQKTPRQSDLAEAIADYLNAEQRRDVPSIEAPPATVARFLAERDREIDVIRDHLLFHGDGITWELDLGRGFDAPRPYLLAHLQLARLLTARALIRARSDDARAWDDLRAVTALDRTLQPRPELVSQVIALHLARTVTGAAWKLPLPVPPWFAEFQKEDRRALVMRGIQHDAWLLWRFAPEEEDFAGPAFYVRAAVANLLIVERDSALELARAHGNFDGNAFDKRWKRAIPRWNAPGRIAMPNFGGVWSRVLRYEAEREVAANALRMREGLSD